MEKQTSTNCKKKKKKKKKTAKNGPVLLTWLPDKFRFRRSTTYISQDSGYGGHLGFLIETILVFLSLSTSHPDVSYQVLSQLDFRSRRRSEKQIFNMAAMTFILDFPSEWF